MTTFGDEGDVFLNYLFPFYLGVLQKCRCKCEHNSIYFNIYNMFHRYFSHKN